MTHEPLTAPPPWRGAGRGGAVSGLAWGLWLASGTRVLAVAVVIAVLAAPPAEAQTPTPDPAPPDSVAGDSTAEPDSVAAPPRPDSGRPAPPRSLFRMRRLLPALADSVVIEDVATDGTFRAPPPAR